MQLSELLRPKLSVHAPPQCPRKRLVLCAAAAHTANSTSSAGMQGQLRTHARSTEPCIRCLPREDGNANASRHTGARDGHANCTIISSEVGCDAHYVDHCAPARQSVAVHPRQQALRHRLKELLRVLSRHMPSPVSGTSTRPWKPCYSTPFPRHWRSAEREQSSLGNPIS